MARLPNLEEIIEAYCISNPAIDELLGKIDFNDASITKMMQQIHGKSNWRNSVSWNGTTGEYGKKLLKNLKAALSSMPALENELIVYRNYGDRDGHPNIADYAEFPLSATVSPQYLENWNLSNPTEPHYVTLRLQPGVKVLPTLPFLATKTGNLDELEVLLPPYAHCIFEEVSDRVYLVSLRI
jgi:hypothetical protein